MASSCPIIVQPFAAATEERQGNTTDRVVGTFVRLSCQDEHSLIGPEVLQCTDSGWDKTVPVCIPNQLDGYLKDRCSSDDSMVILWAVSGVIGGLCLLILVIILVAYTLRRQRRQQRLKNEAESYYTSSSRVKPADIQRYPPDQYMHQTGRHFRWNDHTTSSRANQHRTNMVMPYNTNYGLSYPNPATIPGYGVR